MLARMGRAGGRALSGIGLLVCALSATGARDPPRAPTPLSPGAPLERTLAAGEVHAYLLGLEAGRRWRVRVEQDGIDVALEARPLAGGAGETVDGPLARHGSEWLVLPAGAAGAWRLEVRAPALGVGPGRYSVRLDALPEATAEERLRLEAETALTRVGRLAREATPESRRAALADCARALELWRALAARREQGLTLDAAAALHVLLGEWREAGEGYAAALRVWQELGDAPRQAAALNEQGLAESSLGHAARARERLERALALRQRLDDAFGQAETLANLGLTYHVAGELEAALERYRRALAVARARGETRQESALLNNIGGVHYLQGEPDAALEHYAQALAVRQRLGDRIGEAEVLNNIALQYRLLGQTQEALQSYAQVLEIARAAADRRIEARALNNLGFAYQVLGDARRARTFYEQALPLRRATGDRAGEAATLNNLASAHLASGEAARAVELEQRAVALMKAVGNRLGEGSALVILARAQAASQQVEEALGSLDAALAVAREVGGRTLESEVLQRRGEALELRAQPEAARAALLQALELRRATRQREAEAETLYALARVERNLGRPAEALERVRAAIAVIESLRTRVASPELRATFFGARRPAYDLQIDLLMALDRAEPGAGHVRVVLEASEAARARTLLDLLSEAGADLGERIEPALAERRRALLRRLSAKAARRLELAARGPADDPRLGQLDQELNAVRAELDDVEADMRRRDARYAALTRPPDLDAAGIQALLEDDTLLLEYALGEERSWLWLVAPRALEAFELPPRREIEAAAQAAYDALAVRDAQRGAAGDALALARLARLVLGPVASRLGGRRLVIVPDGALHYVPFAALPEPAGDSTSPQSAGAPALLVRHEIVSLPSVQGLAALRREAERRPAPARLLAVLADPVFDADDPRLGGGRARASADTRGPRAVPAAESDAGTALEAVALGRLEATRREAEAIVRLVAPGQAQVALGFDANRAALLEGTLGSARVLHFATHGVLDTRSPELSGLVLSRFAPDGRRRDGFLRLQDVYGLRLPSDLVVLSGCQTALGREVRGEGLVGLTSGFMYAGVPRVAASLWRVPDRATAELMQRFYEGLLRDGLSAAAALRRAQLGVRAERRWSDPYYWAAFVLEGDWR
jgi:CHAT domain-containing protein/Flp pilus assembly protein TadD